MEKIQKRFFIGGLDFKTTKQTVRDYFSQFGELQSCEVVIERKTGNPNIVNFKEYQKDLDSSHAAMTKHTKE